MKKYIILKSNIEDLEFIVNEHIAKGYAPCGNLILSPQGTYVQTMYKSINMFDSVGQENELEQLKAPQKTTKTTKK